MFILLRHTCTCMYTCSRRSSFASLPSPYMCVCPGRSWRGWLTRGSNSSLRHFQSISRWLLWQQGVQSASVMLSGSKVNVQPRSLSKSLAASRVCICLVFSFMYIYVHTSAYCVMFSAQVTRSERCKRACPSTVTR